MFKVARPMVFDNRCEGFEYSTGGSCVVVALHERFYAVTALHVPGIRNFWLIKCQRCKEENLSQRII